MNPEFSTPALTKAHALSLAVLACTAATPELRAAAQALKTSLDEMAAERGLHADAIASARSRYANNDLEIDDNPILSIADKGVWVSAWVWVESSDDGQA